MKEKLLFPGTAKPSCPQCGKKTFEMQAVKIRGEMFGHWAVNCAHCGAVVSVQEYENIPGALTEPKAKPSCPKCGTKTFEIQAVEIKGAKFPHRSVNCINCGTVISVHQSEDIPDGLEKPKATPSCRKCGKTTFEMQGMKKVQRAKFGHWAVNCASCGAVVLVHEYEDIPHSFGKSLAKPSCPKCGKTTFEMQVVEINRVTDYHWVVNCISCGSVVSVEINPTSLIHPHQFSSSPS